jgi:hypothetical protein
MSKKDTVTLTLVADLVERISPILAGHPPEVQSAALADLTAMWLAGMQTPMSLAGLPDKDLEALRADLFAEWCKTVRDLVPPNVAIIRERLEQRQ